MVSVYIVDDSELFVNELIETTPWASLGCIVVGSARNADIAEREIREKQPEIVITDISMPGRDGLSLIGALEDLTGIEYILVSAYSRFEYALKAIRLKTADYFVKPFDDEEFYAAIVKLATRIENRKGAQSPSEEPQAYSDVIRRAVDYLDIHYAEALNAELVAKELFISESYLSKRFRRELNTSFVEYLNYVRIRKASQLLQTTDMKIYEVSEAVGFSDAKYFATLFRKYTEATPTQYRKK